jgi:hypothetical protein
MDIELASTHCGKLRGSKPTFIVNKSIKTWQESHVWFVRDAVSYSQGIEEFLAKVFLCNPFALDDIYKGPWEKRVELPFWLRSLKITAADFSYIDLVVSMARSDIKEMETLHPDGSSWIENIEIPTSGWMLQETIEPRNPVGPTYIALFRSAQDFVFIEVHNES